MVEYGLIGRGISHSFSAGYFNDKFLREKLDARYLAFDMEEISRLPELLERNPLLRGLNVTSPYKREVIPFLEGLTEEARILNAVNVIQFRSDGSLVGHNTDWKGFQMTLDTEAIKKHPPRVALILGTGGAASAVALALEKEGIDFRLVSRNPEGSQISYASANELMPEANLIVNATPLGMYPHVDECPPLDYNKLSEAHICYDLIYNPPETLFLKKAAEKGATTKNGLEMLINQARLSWEIWNAG